MQENETQGDLNQDLPQGTTPTDLENQSPSNPDAGHDANQGESTGTTPAPLDDNGDNVESEPDIEAMRREYGKLKQTQEELKKLKESTTKAAKEAETYKRWILGNPERAKEALVEIEGYSQAQAEELIQKTRQQNPQLWKETKKERQAEANLAKSQESGLDAGNVQQLVEQTLAQRDYVNRFFTALPDLNPSNIQSDDEREEKKQLALNVDYLAQSLRGVDPSLSEESSWSEAYKFITKKTDAEIQEAREQGKLEGMLAVTANRASTRAPSSGAMPKSGGVSLTEEESRLAQQYGITPEEWVKYSSGPGKV